MIPVIYIATSNAHKLSEFSEMFSSRGISAQVFGARDIAGFEFPEEDGSTFAENAFIKARALTARAPKDAYVFADDSGICVDALGGAPGIHSARYSGTSGADADANNNKKLLEALKDVPDASRGAHFACAIALICPDGEEKLFEGRIDGFINRGAKGLGGFGYDPLFYVPKLGSTTAEIPAHLKNTLSHRGIAFGKMADFIKERTIK